MIIYISFVVLAIRIFTKLLEKVGFFKFLDKLLKIFFRKK